MNFVKGHNGVKIAYYDNGTDSDKVLLLIHGFSQSSLCWKKQIKSKTLSKFKIISIDIRGHGASGKPQDPDAYNNHIPFAHDINSVINKFENSKILPVCWSMGGNWICDYLREFGGDKISGLFLVSATTQQGTSITEKFFGKGAIDNLSNLFDEDTNVNISATKAFVNACVSKGYKNTEFEEILAYNMIVTPEIRQWILGRVSDNSEIISKLTCPIAQVHGKEDKVVLPFAGEYTISQVSHSNKKFKLYNGIGHSPFFEDPDLFNNDLFNFAQEVF